LLAGGGSDELRDHVQQLRRDLEMVLRLEDIGILTADAKNDRLDWDVVDPGYAKAFAHYGVMDQGYADAFAEYGIDVLNLPVEEAAARIQVRDWLAIPLSVALDDWASTPSLRNESDRAKIRAVANAVDPDPWRRQVREAVEKRDGRALTDLAGSPNLAQQSRNSIVVLKHGLRFHGLKEKSLEVLRMLQRQYPGDFWLNYWLADELNVFPDSDRDEAISFARAAVAIRPKSAAAHLLLANSLQNKGKFDEAYIYNRNAIELAPNYAYAHNDFGWTLFRLGKVDDAIACYHKAIELNPKYALAYINLGVALVTLKKLTDGIAAFRRSIEIYPKYDVAYSNLGNALWRQGKLDEASDCFDKAVELVPNNAYARQTAARAFALTGQWDKAVVHTGKVIEMRPSDDNWWMIHATFVLRSGDVEAYRQVCNAMIEKFRQTKEPIVAHRLACTCLLIPDAVSDAKLPQKLAEFSAAGAHGIPWADITMGLAHYRAGQFEQAIERLKPYSGQPEFEIGTSFFIAMSHQRLDQRGEARQWFDKAVRIMDQEMAAKEIGRHRVDSQSWAANQVIRVEAEELFKK
jgi:tetratricopeptide (TPR) repeat protein